jgi:N-acetylneuraminic acid mutarotase
MKKILVMLCLCAFGFAAKTQNVWTLKDSVNGPGRSVVSSFVAYGQGWLVSGLDDGGFSRKMYSYNPVQNDWDDELSIGGLSGDGLERGSATGFSIKNKGYICLGQGDFVGYSNDLWEYDPATQTWSQKADFVGESRRQAVAFTLNDLAYVGTGQSATGLKKDFYKYDATNNVWTAVADFGGTPRRQAVSFVIGAHGYVATGDDGVARNDMWQYSPLTDTWVQKANFAGDPRSGASGWSIGNSGFVALGEDATSNYRKDVWQYYYYSNSWVQRSDFPSSARKNATAFVIDNVAYVGTGYDGLFKDDFYCYTAILGTDEKEIQFSSSVFPNPAQEICIISLGEQTAHEIDIEVFSVTGSRVTENISVQKQGNELSLDLSNLNTGTYLYCLKNKTNDIVSKGKISHL